jgi:dihydroorotase
MGELKEAGCVAVSDDGKTITNGAIMRRALEYSRNFNLPVITHAEDPAIAGPGVMNEGVISTRLGLKGRPAAAEDATVARDIQLAEFTGGRLHVAHVTTKGAVELIRAAKKRKVNVTAEATPHHLVLTDEAVIGYDTNTKVSPPLRSLEDREALRGGLKDGTIDCVATDHAPHSTEDKDVEFDAAQNGMVGLETALPLILGLVEEGVLTLNEAIRAMTVNPSKAFALEKGTLSVGSPAEITIVDLERRWTIDPAKFKSKGRNTPFAGKEVKGAVVKTIVDGRIVFIL